MPIWWNWWWAEQQNNNFLLLNNRGNEDFSAPYKNFSTFADAPEDIKKIYLNVQKDTTKVKKVEAKITTPEAKAKFKKRLPIVKKEIEELKKKLNTPMLSLEKKDAYTQQLQALKIEEKNLTDITTPTILLKKEDTRKGQREQSYNPEDPLKKRLERSVLYNLNNPQNIGQYTVQEDEQTNDTVSWSWNQGQGKIDKSSKNKEQRKEQEKQQDDQNNNDYEMTKKRLGQQEAFVKIQNLVYEYWSQIILPPIIYKLASSYHYTDLSETEIKSIQAEFWIFWDAQDGVFGRDTYNHALAYFRKRIQAQTTQEAYTNKTKKDNKKEHQNEKNQNKEGEQNTQQWKDTIQDTNLDYTTTSLTSTYTWEDHYNLDNTNKNNTSESWEENQTRAEEKQPTRENAQKIYKETDEKYNISEQVKLSLPYAKNFLGEATALKQSEIHIQTLHYQWQEVENKIQFLEKKKDFFTKRLENVSPEEQENINSILQTIENRIEENKKIRQSILSQSRTQGDIFKRQQQHYLITIQNEIREVKQKLDAWSLQEWQGTMEELHNRLNFLQGVERSQRMLSGVDGKPNIYGFYLNKEGVLLRRNSQDQKEGTVNPYKDYQEGSYQTDQFWRLIYYDKTSEGKVIPRLFSGFKGDYTPKEYKYTTQEVVSLGKKEMIGEHNRNNEQRTDINANTSHNQYTNEEAKDNRKE